jgi:RimJ/RimL family protein N-acetyltransferase
MKIKLDKLTKDSKKELYELVSDENVMKYVGIRKVWSNEKTEKFIQYSLQEQKEGITSTLYNKIVFEDGTFIGIIGIHKYKNEDKYSLTRYIHKKFQGKGIGTKALSLMLDKFHDMNPNIDTIYSDTLDYNIAAQRSLVKSGFMFDSSVRQIGSNYRRYKYRFSLHEIIKYKYPYMEYFMTPDDVSSIFDKLRNFKSTSTTREDGSFGFDISINYDVDKNLNRITDYFTDSCRVMCKFKGNLISPYEYYKKNKGVVLEKSLINGKFDYDKFEDTMYRSIKMCNNFQITIIMNIYHHFQPKRILDSSAGWGDRLIAAVAYGAEYTGVDPSGCLEPLYKKIMKTLSKDTDKYKVIQSPFEKISKDDLVPGYDLAFTSPPFFDLEVYNDEDSQSIAGKGSLKRWIEYFLLVLADLNIHYLKIGGYFVIYVPEYREFMDYMRKRDDVKYCGTIKYYYTHLNKKKRKIMVWKKIK